MSREEALRQADAELESLIKAGDPAIMEAARVPDGKVDQARLATAAMRARERLADQIQAGKV